MTKTLRVIDGFFIAEEGDTFNLTEDGSKYSLEKNEEFYKFGDDSKTEVQSSYSSKFQISISYAKQLVDEGYLEEVTDKSNKQFVNVFSEIDTLIEKYTN